MFPAVFVEQPNCIKMNFDFWKHSKEHSRNIQRTFRKHSVNIQCTFREHTGNIRAVGAPAKQLCALKIYTHRY